MKRMAALCLLLALLCSGCGAPSRSASSAGPEPEPPASSGSATEEAAPSAAEPVPAQAPPYVRALANAAVQELVEPGMSDAEKVRAAYEYVIARTWFAAPVGLDLWRAHDGPPPDYLETRALSPLRFGIGSCEDYAAALAVLLQQMGFEARYVPGLTISVSGAFVDHAWTAVELDGAWYHLDAQLEDNVMRAGRLTYRYFLRSDQTMLADHRWGENLLQYASLTPEQRAQVEADYLLPECPRDHPSPEPKQLEQGLAVSRAAAQAEAQAELARYEAEHGPLEPMEQNEIPPVFGAEGYGPKDD